ncbi:methyltransferase [Catenovulum sp. 2E275]|uniref:tRNA1(Val) (adenine(37)-N6)-methyltransferase n=1 Tax=Catenovulum sp. 2E275 TaxID=2980497 RepID=UPI0021D2755A|nr:methyltransferase [Catenovulum sp. 2E275]MCU4676978.1 methyltransferase [Catenovulum sp. 2E275]
MFKCKQFTVKQDLAAMKVSTDSLILGSWSQLADLLDEDDNKLNSASSLAASHHVLDIGTGTGILSLMLAQKTQASLSPVYLDAIELDSAACQQAEDNFINSKWRDRLAVRQVNFFDLQQSDYYSWAIANPPYFSSDNCSDQQRQLARQLQGNSWSDWFTQCHLVLKNKAKLEMIIPADIADKLVSIAGEKGFNLIARLDIMPAPNKAAKRVCLRFEKSADQINHYRCESKFDREPAYQQQSLLIYQQDNQYSPAYKALCKAFYLKF